MAMGIQSHLQVVKRQRDTPGQVRLAANDS
jgi:hypothetical protein